MNVYEREYFVSRVRSGIYFLKDEGLRIKVVSPSMEDEFLANDIFMESFFKFKDEGIMTKDDMDAWMKENNLWSDKEEKEIEQVNKDIDKVKEKMYLERHSSNIVSGGKLMLVKLNKALKKLKSQKDEYFENTCEGLAYQEKALFLFKRCCYVNGERFDFKDLDPLIYYFSWLSQLLSESQSRELARNDPWRHHWMFKNESRLFNNNDRELSPDQKNILIWSKMYDNVYESPECPKDDVISDDDLLDGWFIYQKKKQEEDREDDGGIADKISSNPRTAGAQEVMLIPSNEKDVENINKLNSPVAMRNKANRIKTVKEMGKATDLDFADKKMELRTQQNEMFKNNFRR